MKQTQARRAIGCVLAGAVFFTQAAGATRQERNFWEQRRFAARRQAGAAAPVVRWAAADIPLSPKISGAPAWLAAVTPHGDVREVNLASRPAAPLIIHIQDVHEHGEAQRHISAMVSALGATLSSPDAPLLVGLEGASGAFDLRPYREFSNRSALRDLADAYLRENLLTGAEHAAWIAEQAPLLRGVEDAGPYLAHVQAFKDALGRQAELQGILDIWKTGLEERKALVYPPELRALDGLAARFQEGALGLGEYVRGLYARAAPPAGRFRELDLFLKAVALEESMDFSKIESERKALIETLSKSLDAATAAALAEKGLQHRQGRLGPGAFHAYLHGLSRRSGLTSPALAQYVEYAQAAEDIRRDRVPAELAALERLAWRALLKTTEQRDLRALDEERGRLRQLSALAMTPADWAAHQQGPRRDPLPGLPVLPDGILSPFESFCRLALARDRVMVDNLLKAMEARPSAGPVAVLVAGGFHSAGMTDLLRARGASCVVVSPKITEIKEGGPAYEALVRGPHPLDRLFLPETIHLQPPLVGTGAETPFAGYGERHNAGRTRTAVYLAGPAGPEDGGILNRLVRGWVRVLSRGLHTVVEVSRGGLSTRYRVSALPADAAPLQTALRIGDHLTVLEKIEEGVFHRLMARLLRAPHRMTEEGVELLLPPTHWKTAVVRAAAPLAWSAGSLALFLLPLGAEVNLGTLARLAVALGIGAPSLSILAAHLARLLTPARTLYDIYGGLIYPLFAGALAPPADAVARSPLLRRGQLKGGKPLSHTELRAAIRRKHPLLWKQGLINVECRVEDRDERGLIHGKKVRFYWVDGMIKVGIPLRKKTPFCLDPAKTPPARGTATSALALLLAAAAVAAWMGGHGEAGVSFATVLWPLLAKPDGTRPEPGWYQGRLAAFEDRRISDTGKSTLGEVTEVRMRRESSSGEWSYHFTVQTAEGRIFQFTWHGERVALKLADRAVAEMARNLMRATGISTSSSPRPGRPEVEALARALPRLGLDQDDMDLLVRIFAGKDVQGEGPVKKNQDGLSKLWEALQPKKDLVDAPQPPKPAPGDPLAAPQAPDPLEVVRVVLWALAVDGFKQKAYRQNQVGPLLNMSDGQTSKYFTRVIRLSEDRMRTLWEFIRPFLRDLSNRAPATDRARLRVELMDFLEKYYERRPISREELALAGKKAQDFGGLLPLLRPALLWLAGGHETFYRLVTAPGGEEALVRGAAELLGLALAGLGWDAAAARVAGNALARLVWFAGHFVPWRGRRASGGDLLAAAVIALADLWTFSPAAPPEASLWRAALIHGGVNFFSGSPFLSGLLGLRPRGSLNEPAVAAEVERMLDYAKARGPEGARLSRRLPRDVLVTHSFWTAAAFAAGAAAVSVFSLRFWRGPLLGKVIVFRPKDENDLRIKLAGGLAGLLWRYGATRRNAADLAGEFRRAELYGFSKAAARSGIAKFQLGHPRQAHSDFFGQVEDLPEDHIVIHIDGYTPPVRPVEPLTVPVDVALEVGPPRLDLDVEEAVSYRLRPGVSHLMWLPNAFRRLPGKDGSEPDRLLKDEWAMARQFEPRDFPLSRVVRYLNDRQIEHFYRQLAREVQDRWKPLLDKNPSDASRRVVYDGLLRTLGRAHGAGYTLKELYAAIHPEWEAGGRPDIQRREQEMLIALGVQWGLAAEELQAHWDVYNRSRYIAEQATRLSSWPRFWRRGIDRLARLLSWIFSDAAIDVFDVPLAEMEDADPMLPSNDPRVDQWKERLSAAIDKWKKGRRNGQAGGIVLQCNADLHQDVVALLERALKRNDLREVLVLEEALSGPLKASAVLNEVKKRPLYKGLSLRLNVFTLREDRWVLDAAARLIAFLTDSLAVDAAASVSKPIERIRYVDISA